MFSDGLFFPRAARPPVVVGKPSVVSFAVGALPGFCSCVYLRWRIPQEFDGQREQFCSYLLCAKSKVTPLSGLTTPRVELSSLFSSIDLPCR